MTDFYLVDHYASIYDDHYPFGISGMPADTELAAWRTFAIDLRDMLPWIAGKKYWRRGPSLFKQRNHDGHIYYVVEAQGYAIKDNGSGEPESMEIDVDAILKQAGIE